MNEMFFETLENRCLLSGEAGDAFVADFNELIASEMSREEVAAVMADAGLDDVYTRTSWNGENYWFQTSDGDVWALWHGGAVHDPDGDGEFQWNLTNITEETGVQGDLQDGSLSGTFTPWRAMNIVGVNDQGDVVTYWWSPESSERNFGARGNGWCLTNFDDDADFSDLDDDDPSFVGVSITRMAGDDGQTIQIIVDDSLADDVRILIAFRPGQVSQDGKPWTADRRDRSDLGDDGGADDIIYMGDTTIEADETVEDDVRIINGTLTVHGTVEGNIRQFGDGSVVVDGGTVTGNVDEDGNGGIAILSDGMIDGNAEEHGDGDIRVSDGLLDGNAIERGMGDVVIELDSTVGGNIEERGPGGISITDSLLEGNAVERGPGAVTLMDATIDGNIEESGPGGVAILGDSLVRGNVRERGPDAVVVDDTATVDGDIDQDFSDLMA